jgi:hypothetical protein
MSSDLYARGNGAKALKKRFTVFKQLIKYSPIALLLAGYVILQAQVKMVCRENGNLIVQKNILVEELERLSSDYDKMLSYGEIKEFAQTELAMTHSVNNIKTFAVVDKEDIFKASKPSELPVLFETNFDLASIEPEVPVISDKE